MIFSNTRAQSKGQLDFERAFLAKDTICKVPAGKVWRLRSAFREQTVVYPVRDTQELKAINSRTRVLMVSTTIEPDTQSQSYSNISVYREPSLFVNKHDLPLWVSETTTVQIHPSNLLHIMIEQYNLNH